FDCLFAELTLREPLSRGFPRFVFVDVKLSLLPMFGECLQFLKIKAINRLFEEKLKIGFNDILISIGRKFTKSGLNLRKEMNKI
ncbi:unnamed protein product, partial [Rotaria sp. Silwood1]